MNAPVHKVIITGTGRSGTTFLVRLLTELGLDTGYTRDTWQKDYFEHCQAGLEHELTSEGSPYIIKNPALCETLERDLASGIIVIDHALIPVRELKAAANSRIRIGGENGSIPGGLKGTNDPAQQIAVLGESFHKLVVSMTAHEIPHTFLLFPRFVEDADYAFKKLRCVLGDCDRTRFGEAFARIANPKLVHTFDNDQRADPVTVACFENQIRRKKSRRRLRRALIQAAVAASLAVNISAWFPFKRAPIEADGKFAASLPPAVPQTNQSIAVPRILPDESSTNKQLAGGSWVKTVNSTTYSPTMAENSDVFHMGKKALHAPSPLFLIADPH